MEKPKTVAITSPPPQQPPRKRWFDSIKTFSDNIPNPRISTIFLISSFATFFSGIALAFEWTFHGKNHVGFQWIIFYALFVIFLPVLIWLGLGIVMVVSSVVEEKEEEETKDNNNCRSLAVLVESDSEKVSDENNNTSKLKRSVSYPLHSHQVRSCRTR